MKFISHTKSFVSRVEPCRCFSFALLEYSARDCTKVCSIGAQSLALHSLQLNTKYVRELSTQYAVICTQFERKCRERRRQRRRARVRALEVGATLCCSTADAAEREHKASKCLETIPQSRSRRSGI
ncbi:hypothetical protein EVAR_3417_1 [Eumeta japonica]|uniref:Uncharacterized protein n=1 Tax=Eumeta variegata TaxID=151549 RepID=A0A4C1ST18_EUMVA|nr:hypothetical protein EVAR_3417_1 [Eumeta japonica]